MPPKKGKGDDAKKEKEAEEYGKKLDLCLADGIVKTGAGLMLGGLTSMLFFRWRRWPWIMGFGMGAGVAYANCEHELNSMIVRAMPKETEHEG